jgi:hypothetical protein
MPLKTRTLGWAGAEAACKHARFDSYLLRYHCGRVCGREQHCCAKQTLDSLHTISLFNDERNYMRFSGYIHVMAWFQPAAA